MTAGGVFTSRTAEAAVLILMTTSAVMSASAAQSALVGCCAGWDRMPGRLPTARPAWARGPSAACCTRPYSEDTAAEPGTAQRARFCAGSAELDEAAGCCCSAVVELGLPAWALSPLLLVLGATWEGSLGLSGNPSWEGFDALKRPEREFRRLPLCKEGGSAAAWLCASAVGTLSISLQG